MAAVIIHRLQVLVSLAWCLYLLSILNMQSICFGSLQDMSSTIYSDTWEIIGSLINSSAGESGFEFAYEYLNNTISTRILSEHAKSVSTKVEACMYKLNRPLT